MLLDAIDSDSKYDIGPELIDMPKFIWSTEALNKNIIDLFCIVDFCLQDSNKETLIMTRFQNIF
jgi:hypothetical protein